MIRLRILTTVGITVLAVLPWANPAIAAVAIPTITVSVDTSAKPTSPIPSGFVGLSLEARNLAGDSLRGDRGNLAALLATLGPGSVLRFGGNSVDTQFWRKTSSEPVPTWANSVISTADLHRLATLISASGAKVILGVNTLRFDPLRASAEASAAHAALGSSLIGIEVGNEPNLYANTGLRPPTYGPLDYQGEYLTYQSAINAVVPDLPVVGPSDYVPWLRAGALPTGTVPGQFVSQHLYPLSHCLTDGKPPTARGLLGTRTAGEEIRQLTAGVQVATSIGMPLRLTESNNVICSGMPGVSDTYASALWSLDYLVSAARAGVASVSLHGGLYRCDDNPRTPWYSPLCATDDTALAQGVFTPQPEWAGMAMAASLSGTAFLPTSYHSTSKNVLARTTIGGDGTVRVLLLEKDLTGSGVNVDLKIPGGYDTGTVMRLRAPSVDARTGITVGGSPITSTGAVNSTSTETVTSRNGVVRVRLPAISAAVITFSPRCTVPKVVGKSLTEARKLLASAGCRPGIIALPRGMRNSKNLVIVRQALHPDLHRRWHNPVHLRLAPRKT